MDTPDRNQISNPLTKFEESPFSNFANSLSPINPVKTIHVSQTFSSLSFTSPPSVFTSPHVSIQKESRFLRRHQVSDLAKEQFTSVEGSKGSKTEVGTNTDQQLNKSTDAEVRGEGFSSNEGSSEPLCSISKGAAELPRLLKYDSGSPDCRTTSSSGMETICEADSSLALVPYGQEPSIRGSYGNELPSQVTDHDNEEDTCDWQSLISCSTDLFAFDSPNDAATLKGPFRRALEHETTVYASLLARFPPNEAKDLQTLSHAAASCSFNEVHESLAQSTQPSEDNELNQIDQTQESLENSCMNEYISGDTGDKSGTENFYSLYRGRGMRRRCLTFDMTRPKKSADGVPFSGSLSSFMSGENPLSASKQPVTPLGDSSRCILPGIGLHLNPLAAASSECGILYQEMLSPTSQEPPNNSSASETFEKDGRLSDNGLEDSAQLSTHGASDELNSNSPKKKRRKFENITEGGACKRCNCKKSKCLKLYCECFAAGVYCVEPCSCQECFNKPIHEDIVLATRKQIESRNPLAFAPKVIRTSDSPLDHGEDTTRTPASARHKRGCNCKKSGCLKKYCECYQGGVGCSINCRCEGCKNSFGKKTWSTLVITEAETEHVHVSERSIVDKSINTPEFCSDDNKNSEFTLPKTPLRHSRISIQLPSSSKGKPPRSSSMTLSSSSLHPNNGIGRSTFLRSQSMPERPCQNVTEEDEIPAVLQNGSPSSSGIKTLSPNSKRISPPHHDNGQSPKLRSSRKLILQSIPSFPSLTPGR